MRSRFKKAFLKAHPICCFCGGGRAATTVDHQPSESIYPEWTDRRFALVFPACSQCNAASRRAESVLPLILPKEPGEGEVSDGRFERFVKKQVEWKPDRIRAMMPTTRELRNILGERGLQPPPGALYRDLPILQLDQGEWGGHFEVVSRKLILALHDRHTGAPLAHTGRLTFHRYFNFEALNNLVPESVNAMLEIVEMDAEALPMGPELEVGHRFEDGVHAFMVNLRNKILLIGVSSDDPALLQAPDDIALSGPFDWR